MSHRNILSTLLVVLALAACSEREFEPVVASDDGEGGVEPLPAPLPAAGPVTGVPEPRGPASGLLSDPELPPDAALPTLSTITPAPASDLPSGSGVALATEDGAVAVITFADSPLPPLEDNPESGLAPAPDSSGGPAAGTPPDGSQAASAVRAYYDAVRSGDLARAYAAWSDGGRASGRTPEQFAAGLEGLEVVSVSIGEAGRMEGAAGSRYVELPVTVTSRGRDGGEVRQVGSFVMRSAQVEGAAPGWFIDSAELRELRP